MGFNSSTLDASIWGDPWSGTAGGGYNCTYEPSNISIADSVITMQCTQSGSDFYGSGIGSYEAVMLAEKGGIWACRVKMTLSDSVDGVIFGWGADNTGTTFPEYGEQDFVESNPYYRDPSTSFAMNTHWGSNSDPQQDPLNDIGGPVADWTIYWCVWNPGEAIQVLSGSSNIDDATSIGEINNSNITGASAYFVAEILAQAPSGGTGSVQMDWATQFSPELH